MKSLLNLTSSRAVLRIARGLVVVLAFLSSRTSVFSPPSWVYDGKRPRPSKQALPTHPARPTADEDTDCGRDRVHPRLLVEAIRPFQILPVVSWASHQHLRTESTKPEYLQFFKSNAVQNYLSPPA